VEQEAIPARLAASARRVRAEERINEPLKSLKSRKSLKRRRAGGE
jgi:hypothetical protein